MKNPGPHLRQLPQAMDQKNPGPHLRQLPQAMDQRGEEPWASSEAAASGHGYTEVAWSSKNIMLNYTCMHAAVITSSSSFHACVLHFVLDMASLWYKWVWVQCPKCKVWKETLAPLNADDVVQETQYCGKCTIWWNDMHRRVWWPATRAYIVMLARCSVQANPNAVL